MNASDYLRTRFQSDRQLAIYAQNGFTNTMQAAVAGKMPVGVYLIQVFGIQQKAAMAARALKAINPNYCWILYHAKLEMLYYFVESVLSEITGNVNAGVYSTLDQLAGHIREKFGV